MILANKLVEASKQLSSLNEIDKIKLDLGSTSISHISVTNISNNLDEIDFESMIERVFLKYKSILKGTDTDLYINWVLTEDKEYNIAVSRIHLYIEENRIVFGRPRISIIINQDLVIDKWRD